MCFLIVGLGGVACWLDTRLQKQAMARLDAALIEATTRMEIHDAIQKRETASVPMGDAEGQDETADLIRLLDAQREWSAKTFGPGDRRAAILAHLGKEAQEVEDSHGDLEEWIDMTILALDGAWRTGASSRIIVACLNGKYAKNRARTWPDWRTTDPDAPIEHIKDERDLAEQTEGGKEVRGRQ